MAKKDLALDLFHSFQTHKRKPKKQIKESTQTATDPQPLGDVLSKLIHDRQWKTGIAEGTLFSSWASIVGEQISQHTTPISLLDGVLTIRTSSTAWSTQLQLVAPDVLQSIQHSAPGALVDSLNILGPDGPSWKHGRRSIKGAQGPRDTYT